jgi:glycosyltransferase involved in cell wall biosynthesis
VDGRARAIDGRRGDAGGDAMSPRVLIDLRVGQTSERTGLARAAWSLADALIARGRGTYLLAGAQDPMPAADGVLLPFDIPVGDHGRGEQWMAALAELYDADAILSTYHALPDAPRPRVLTIHDLLPLRHPEWFADARVHRFFDVTLRDSARRADRIIVDTEVVRGDVAELFAIAPDRIAVVPLAPVLPQTRRAAASSTAAPARRDGDAPGGTDRTDRTDQTDRTTRSGTTEKSDRARVQALGIDGPFLLTVATLEPRKNLVRLVQAFAAAKARAGSDWPRLVIAGRLGWKWREILDASASTQGVHVAGYVDDETLSALLHTAVAFVFPSLDEGFGLPVLEAMACGCPVLTSDVPVLREVAGDAAAFIDPLDVDCLAAGLEALVADETRRRVLVDRGYARAAQFSWARTAAGVEAIIASVL